MRGPLTFKGLLRWGVGLALAGFLLMVPPAVDAAQRIVRLNIPGCMN